MTQRRQGRSSRLPAPVRAAVRDLEGTFHDGTDEQYGAALEHLTWVSRDLSPEQRQSLDRALSAAHERTAALTFTAQVKEALRTGTIEVRRQLPGAVELVEVTGTDLTQLLLTLPVTLPDDPPHIAELVADARTAALTGTCPRCAGELVASLGEQLYVEHTARCPVSETALARARSRAA